MGHIGTGNDPTGSAYVADWDLAAARWNFFGERAAPHGLKLYTHNHDIAYSFLLDSGPLDALGRPTRSSAASVAWSTSWRTPTRSYVYLEMDIYWAHVAQYKHTTYTAPDGSVVELIFDPAAVVAAQTHALPALPREGRQDQHGDQPTATTWRRSARATSTTRRSSVASAPRATHNPMWEMDTAPGNATTAPNQSLELAKVSVRRHGRPPRLTRLDDRSHRPRRGGIP